MSVLGQLRYFASIGDRLGYYGVLSASGDRYGDLAASVVTNATLAGAAANAFILDGASEAGRHLSSTQLSQIGLELMRADLSLREGTPKLGWREIQEYHNRVFVENGLPADAWTLNVPLNSYTTDGERSTFWDRIIDSNPARFIVDVALDVWPKSQVVSAEGAYYGEYIADLLEAGVQAPFTPSNSYGGYTITTASGSVIGGLPSNDGLSGGAGQDVLMGFNGADALSGAAGNDRLYGGESEDALQGNAGADNLYGDGGRDTLTGGDADASNSIARDDGVTDLLAGGTGFDTYNLYQKYDISTGRSFADLKAYVASVDIVYDEDGRGVVDYKYHFYSSTTPSYPTGPTLDMRIEGGYVLRKDSSGQPAASFDGFTAYRSTSTQDAWRVDAGVADLGYGNKYTLVFSNALRYAPNPSFVVQDFYNGDLGIWLASGAAPRRTLYSGSDADDFLAPGTAAGASSMAASARVAQANASSVQPLSGNGGNDGYLVYQGDGTYTVREWDGISSHAGGTDTILFADGFAIANSAFAKSSTGRDLTIEFAGSTDEIVILEQFGSDDRYDVEFATFTDGTLSRAEMEKLSETGAAKGSYLSANRAAAITGTDGGDVIHGSLYGDTLNGGNGSDIISGAGWEGGIDDPDQINGGPGNDTLKGMGGADTIDGGAGIDTADFSDKTAAVIATLNGSTNATVTVGGTAEDVLRNVENLVGGTAADTLTGDGLANVLTGGTGNDALRGMAGSDTYIYGSGDGADTIVESAGSSDTDKLVLGRGIVAGEVIVSRAASDANDAVITFANHAGTITIDDQFLSGSNSSGIEQIVFADGTTWDRSAILARLGGGGIVNGTSGSDTLTGTNAAEAVNGYAGNDLLKGMGGADTIDGGAGIDTADFADKTAAVVVTLNGSTNATVTVGGTTEDVLRNVENLVGGSGADTLTGDAYANDLSGGGGNDILNGAAGDDLLRGMGGLDTLDGGAGLDTADYSDKTIAVVATLNGSTNATVTVGGTAEDVLRNVENLVGGTAADMLTGDGLANVLTGGAGNDVLKGMGGADTIDGGAGLDTADYSDKTASVIVRLNGANDASIMRGGALEDTLRNIENIVGGSAADILVGDSLANALSGGAGNDLLRGLGGADTLDGGAGIDTADFSDKTAAVVVTLNGSTNATVTVGGTAEDVLRNVENLVGGSSGDTLTGDGLSNAMTGGTGNDTLRGMAGSDTYIYGAGDAADIIVDGAGSSDTDKLLLGRGILAAEVIVSRSSADPNDALITFSNRMGSITIDDQFATASGGIGLEQIVFADGTTWDRIAIAARVTGQGSGTINGTSGDDTLTGTNASEAINGLAGNDLLKGMGGADSIDGGAGIDTADFSDKTAAVVATLNGSTNATVTVGGTAEDVVRNVENLVGGTAADTLTGDELANVLTGGAGNDTLNGGAGDDTLAGEGGADVMNGGDGIDLVSYATSSAGVSIYLWDGGYDGHAQGDTYIDIEGIIGSSYKDIINGQDHIGERLKGGAGDDELSGNGGDDTLEGEDDNDWLSGGFGNDSLVGGAGDDAMGGYDGNDTQTGGLGNDTFIFERDFGRDVVTDFTAGAGSGDLIRFEMGIFTSFQAVLAASTQVGSDVVITYDVDDTLTLRNVLRSNLTADDFEFA